MSKVHIWNVLLSKFIMKTKIYFRYPLNIIYTILEPIIWLVPFFFMGKVFSSDGTFAGFSSYSGSNDYYGFMVTGLVLSMYTSATLWGIGFTLKDEMLCGVLESNWTTPTDKIVLLLSNSVFEFAKATIEIILTTLVCYIFFGVRLGNQMFKCFLFLIPGIIALLGIGIIVASIVLLIRNANSIIDFSDSILLGFSGSNFPLQMLPKKLLFFSFIIPGTYVNDSFRAYMIGTKPLMSLKVEFAILVTMMVIFICLGNICFRIVEKKCKRDGISGY